MVAIGSVTATATAGTRAHQRQGSDPVGVSSRTNPTAASTAAIVTG
jgi:hypothetical protein